MPFSQIDQSWARRQLSDDYWRLGQIFGCFYADAHKQCPKSLALWLALKDLSSLMTKFLLRPTFSLQVPER